METTKSNSEILFEPQPKQEEFINAVFSGEYSFLCYGGSVGGGKSFVGIATLILLCKLFPKSKWVIIRESLPTLKRTSIETFKKVLPANFLKNYNQQDHIATFRNGSQIIFMAEDWEHDKDFDRFKGLEVNGFLMEQIEELQKGLLDVCIMRAGRHRIPKMPPPLVLANLNPTQTWPKEYIYERYINGTLPDDWYYLPATIFDNPVLAQDEAYMSRLKNLDEITYRRLIEGDWSAFAVNNPFAYAFKQDKHVGTAAFNPMKEVMLSFDFNVDPITCVAAQHDGAIKFITEFRLENSDIYKLCDRIKAHFPQALFLVTGDATGHNRSALTEGNINYYTVIQQRLGLSDGQMKQPTVNPSVGDTRVLMNSILQNLSVIFDKDNCPYTIQDLKYTEVDSNGDIKKKENEKMGRGHLLDGTRYLLNTFFGDFIQILN